MDKNRLNIIEVIEITFKIGKVNTETWKKWNILRKSMKVREVTGKNKKI